jgi:hypothetical protein
MNNMPNVEYIHPSELGEEFYKGDTLPEAVNEPQFVGFECLGCGGRHAQLDELAECQRRLMAFYVMQRANAREMQAA